MSFCALQALAEYQPIPAELTTQYKNEITQIINEKYKPTLNEIHAISMSANKMYKQVLKDKDLYFQFCINQYDIHITVPEFVLYKDLVSTTKKYITLTDETFLATDDSFVLREFLAPYFKDNTINTSKLEKVTNLTFSRYKRIDKYYQKLHKFVYPEEY